jgi:DsbC/DsbD-like thiol-disulfide interchange protein
MTIVSRWAALALLLWPAAALSEARPVWVQGLHSRVRLLSGGPADEHRLAGLEIELDRGFKTYWRQPGEAGLPPRFDWSGSANLGEIRVLWPAPKRLEDAAGVSYVYGPRVVLPLKVRVADPGRPAHLRLVLEYGVCKEICIPARAELSLDLAAAETPADRRLIEEAGLARVPRPLPLGGEGPLSVVSVAREPGTDKPTYRVSVRGPGGATLFGEGPEEWFVDTSPPRGDGAFTVTIDGKPKDARGPAVLRLTLVAGADAVETEVHLDEDLTPR